MKSIMNANFSPNYSLVFQFESQFDHNGERARWLRHNWHHAYYWIVVYLLVVFGGQHYMEKRKPFSLRPALLVWNLCLAIFSILGSLRTIPEMIYSYKEFGFDYTVCSNSYHTEYPVTSLWTYLFIVSKAPELGDTVFIVLRKQKLIFLHWYHHVTVLLFTWYCYADEASAGRWYTYMNYMVHALMYSYYALRALSIKVPKQVAMLITTSQIVQMIIGTYVTIYALILKRAHHECQISYSTLYLGIVMYFSYFVLFVNFFKNSYFSSKQKSN